MCDATESKKNNESIKSILQHGNLLEKIILRYEFLHDFHL